MTPHHGTTFLTGQEPVEDSCAGLCMLGAVRPDSYAAAGCGFVTGAEQRYNSGSTAEAAYVSYSDTLSHTCIHGELLQREWNVLLIPVKKVYMRRKQCTAPRFEARMCGSQTAKSHFTLSVKQISSKIWRFYIQTPYIQLIFQIHYKLRLRSENSPYQPHVIFSLNYLCLSLFISLKVSHDSITVWIVRI